MRVNQLDPLELRTAVKAAVVDGAWSPTAVVASVASDSVADRAEIIATLWDLRDDGFLVYDVSGRFPGFRPFVDAVPDPG